MQHYKIGTNRTMTFLMYKLGLLTMSFKGYFFRGELQYFEERFL